MDTKGVGEIRPGSDRVLTREGSCDGLTVRGASVTSAVIATVLTLMVKEVGGSDKVVRDGAPAADRGRWPTVTSKSGVHDVILVSARRGGRTDLDSVGGILALVETSIRVLGCAMETVLLSHGLRSALTVDPPFVANPSIRS